MTKNAALLLLYISPRADRSISRKLGREYHGVWCEKHPDAPVIIREIGANPPSAVSEAWIAGVHTPRDQHTVAMREAVEGSDVLIEELLTATEIVIATPIYNFNIPAALKLWIDQVVRVGRTFSVDPNGAKGLLDGKAVKVLISSGGDLRPGTPGEAMNFAEPYLRAIFRFLGIERVTFVYAANQAGAETDRSAAIADALLNAHTLAQS